MRKLRTTAIAALAAAAVLPALATPHPEPAEVPLAEQPAVVDALTVLDLWIDRQLEYRQIPGLSLGIVYEGELIWTKGYGFADLEKKTPATPETLYRIGSVSKLFTSTAVLQLRDRGALGLDDAVSSHLPWFKLHSDAPDAQPITVRHLLTHTAGLPREGAFPYWTTHDFPTRDELIAAVPDQSAVYPPATTYKYSNLGMTLLGEIVAAASGDEYEKHIREQIFLPLGMNASAVFPDDLKRARMATPYMRRMADGSRRVHDYYSTRAVAPAAEIVSSVTDLAAFAALHLQDGGDETVEKILKASTAREMQRPHWVYPSWSGGRGLGFGISHRNGKTLATHGGWIGGNRAHLLLAPGERLAFIAMTNADDAAPHLFSYEAYDVVGPAIAKATGKPTTKPVFDPAWESLVGVYADPWGWEEEAMILGDQLVLYSHSYPPGDEADGGVTPLQHVEGTTFRLPDGETVVFELDEEGRVVRLKKRYEYLYPEPSAAINERPAAAAGNG